MYKSKKDIKIPLDNTLGNDDKFKEEMIKLSEEGFLEILLSDKKTDLKKYYEVTKTEDISVGDKIRKKISVYINKIFLKKEKILEKLLERISELYKINNLNLCKKQRYVDELIIFVYDSLKNIGVTAALYSFELIDGEKVLKKLDIPILEVEEIDKGAYIKFILPIISKLDELFFNLYNSTNIKEVIENYGEDIKKEIEKINNYDKNPPSECTNLSLKVEMYADKLNDIVFYEENNYHNYDSCEILKDIKAIKINVEELLSEQLNTMKIN